MQKTLADKIKNKTPIQNAIISTLAFFSLLKIPIDRERLHGVLYKAWANKQSVNNQLSQLVSAGTISEHGGKIGMFDWNDSELAQSAQEARGKWQKIRRYFWVLSMIPYVEHVSVINSLALGNANLESDIDFFVVTKPNRLYVARSIIIVVFKLLGVYKNKVHIKDRFCFGFYVASDRADLNRVLVKPQDPLFAFWFASFVPILGREAYLNFVAQNKWIKNYFPNFKAENNLQTIIKPKRWVTAIKNVLEILLWIPSQALEPMVRRVHISHTFKLPENSWPTAKTVADNHMLKLHALDPREEFQKKFAELLGKLM